MISSTHHLLLVPSQLTEIVERNESTRRGTTASMRDRITAFPSPPSLLPPPSLVLFYQPSAWNCKSSNKVYSPITHQCPFPNRPESRCENSLEDEMANHCRYQR